MTFDAAKRLGAWTPIPDCPGRFVLRGVPTTMSVAGLLERACPFRCFSHRKPETPCSLFALRVVGLFPTGSPLVHGFTHSARRKDSNENWSSYRLHWANQRPPDEPVVRITVIRHSFFSNPCFISVSSVASLNFLNPCDAETDSLRNSFVGIVPMLVSPHGTGAHSRRRIQPPA